MLFLELWNFFCVRYDKLFVKAYEESLDRIELEKLENGEEIDPPDNFSQSALNYQSYHSNSGYEPEPEIFEDDDSSFYNAI